MQYREEEDSLGSVKVPMDRFWGAQTERSLENFPISHERMPLAVIHALALIKKAAAHTNQELGLLPEEKKELISRAADEVMKGKYDDHFPLKVWQTGSGTQSNMNVNEVISNVANLMAKSKLGAKHPIHPNDDVNCSQSSNDTVPSAISIALALKIHQKLRKNLEHFQKILEKKIKEFRGVVKCGRTHMMDAVPLTVAQEFSAFLEQMHNAQREIEKSQERLLELALGGTAVGTGLNCHPEFSHKTCTLISEWTGLQFVSAPNKFQALGSLDGPLSLSGSLRFLAAALFKMASDMTILGSGPRCGFGELILPANEPGSSIMPGKVNPTQCESLMQVCLQVMGIDHIVMMAACSGRLQLNAFRPLIAYNLVKAVDLLSDSLENFSQKCLKDLCLNKEKIQEHLDNSLMLVTALNPHIGYDRAAKIAKHAYAKGLTLKEAAVDLQILTPEEFDKFVNAKKMTHEKL